MKAWHLEWKELEAGVTSGGTHLWKYPIFVHALLNNMVSSVNRAFYLLPYLSSLISIITHLLLQWTAMALQQISRASLHYYLHSHSNRDVWWPWLWSGQPKHGAHLCGSRALLPAEIHCRRLQQHWCVPTGVPDAGATSRTQQWLPWQHLYHSDTSHHLAPHSASPCGFGLVFCQFGFVLFKDYFLQYVIALFSLFYSFSTWKTTKELHLKDMKK